MTKASQLETLFKKYQLWFLTQIGAFVMGLVLIIDPKNWKIITAYSGYFAYDFSWTKTLGSSSLYSARDSAVDKNQKKVSS